MFGFRLIRFVDATVPPKEIDLQEKILRFQDGSVCAGWYSDTDGWHYSNVAEHMDTPCDPQPIQYADFPR